MFRLTFQIPFRQFKNAPLTTIINIGGLATAILAFFVVVMYARYEKGFDSSNPNYQNIYLLGRNLPNNITDYTSAVFAKTIKDKCPEVVLVGKTKFTTFEFKLSTAADHIYVKKVLSADYDAYKILNFGLSDTTYRPRGDSDRDFFLSEDDHRSLFPGKEQKNEEMVRMGPVELNQNAKVAGLFRPDRHSNVQFDALVISKDISYGTDSAADSYITYLQVAPQADIENLQRKINQIYLDLSSDKIGEHTSHGDNSDVIFLDPLRNLHLNAKVSTANNEKVVNGVLVLGILVLSLGCINSINISTAQAAQRAKEIGIKKVAGAGRGAIALQFLFEIFFQCLLGCLLALLAVQLILPKINNVLGIHMQLWEHPAGTLGIVFGALLVTTLLTGIYPALILSSLRPVAILKGSFERSLQGQNVKKIFLVLQFAIAIAFIIGLLIVRSQLLFMMNEDKGFSTKQIIHIKNQAIFDSEDTFRPVKQKILNVDGVQSVTVASNMPTSPKPTAELFRMGGSENYYGVVNVGSDFFQTLGVKLSAGRFFSDRFVADTASSIILNQTAVRQYNIKDPVGKVISGCGKSFKVVGVIEDYKSEGFEKPVTPTVYCYKKGCGESKTALLVKLDPSKTTEAIESLQREWTGINRLDGEDFRYEFLDSMYGSLFERQKRLQIIIGWLAVVTILIAAFGIYAYAKFLTARRTKEVAVRRVLGASELQVLQLLNLHFLIPILLANALGMSGIYIVAKKWLENFAYTTNLTPWPFLLSAVGTAVLVIFTVCYHGWIAMKKSPANVLKSE